MANENGVKFDPIGWEKGWQSEIEKFDNLINSKKLKKRSFFQKNHVLLVKYIFEDDDYVIIPLDLAERRHDIEHE
jgi:hypothetical protein